MDEDERGRGRDRLRTREDEDEKIDYKGLNTGQCMKYIHLLARRCGGRS